MLCTLKVIIWGSFFGTKPPRTKILPLLPSSFCYSYFTSFYQGQKARRGFVLFAYSVTTFSEIFELLSLCYWYLWCLNNDDFRLRCEAATFATPAYGNWDRNEPYECPNYDPSKLVCVCLTFTSGFKRTNVCINTVNFTLSQSPTVQTTFLLTFVRETRLK